MHILVVGATGLVGRTMLRVLEERNFPIDRLTLLASPRSAGIVIPFRGEDHPVLPLDEATMTGPLKALLPKSIALFSAGGSVSREWAPKFAAAGSTAIDNSSCWRMDPNVPLVVPEVNAADARTNSGIIANPNCSTIQMVVALKPLHEAFGLKRVIVSTYQSVSGAGQKGVDQLRDEIAGRVPSSRISEHTLAYNTVFHSIAEAEGGSEEEIKMQRETRRIMHLPDLRIAVTCVRIPVTGGHAESIAIETERPITPSAAREVLASAPGIVIQDDPANGVYPMPLSAQDTDPVYVGRLRRDDSVENGLMMWVVSDNLRKGAATNAVQIAETLI